MKGQAWNVVETLKEPEHGPLELTRRARVCVWDDLVDIPVAVPMRVPSFEMRRRREAEINRDLDEEMDISAANGSSSKARAEMADLINISSPSTELPNPNRFELATPRMSEDGGSVAVRSPDSVNALNTFSEGAPRRKENASHPSFPSGQNQSLRFEESRPAFSGPKTRTSYHGPSRPLQNRNSRSPSGRRYSLSRLVPNGNGIPGHMLYDAGEGDDHEGDLGYAAAEGMEGNQRKVIVERLETVKSRNPVFTWC